MRLPIDSNRRDDSGIGKLCHPEPRSVATPDSPWQTISMAGSAFGIQLNKSFGPRSYEATKLKASVPSAAADGTVEGWRSLNWRDSASFPPQICLKSFLSCGNVPQIKTGNRHSALSNQLNRRENPPKSNSQSADKALKKRKFALSRCGFVSGGHYLLYRDRIFAA